MKSDIPAKLDKEVIEVTEEEELEAEIEQANLIRERISPMVINIEQTLEVVHTAPT